MTDNLAIAQDLALLEAVEKADDALLDYFRLLEHPFRGGPNYRFLYTTEQVNEAISRCIQMTVKRTNPVYMYGAYGTGKSTIIRRLYALLSLDKRFEVKFIILHNRVTANSLVRNMLEEFGIKTARSFDQSLRNLQNYLHEVNEAQKIPTMLIDEGQYMDKTALQTLHSICNYEDDYVKKLQLVIAGQEDLATKIHLMGEVKSRMKPVQIDPMDAQELEKCCNTVGKLQEEKRKIFPLESMILKCLQFSSTIQTDSPAMLSRLLMMFLDISMLTTKKRSPPQKLNS